MWLQFLKEVTKWWQSKPRKDLVAGIVELRDAMVACQKNYEAHLSSDNQIASRTRWLGSLERLAKIMLKLSRTLEIFGPDAQAAAMEYLYHDYHRASPELTRMSKRFQNKVLTESFNTALSELDRFIRATFKPEEVEAARRLNAVHLGRLGL